MIVKSRQMLVCRAHAPWVGIVLTCPPRKRPGWAVVITAQNAPLGIRRSTINVEVGFYNLCSDNPKSQAYDICIMELI
jgi:hypothetical protein